MTTNATTSARTAARFYTTPTAVDGLFPIIDRADDTTVANVKGRATARAHAAHLTAIFLHAELDEQGPAPKLDDAAQARHDKIVTRTSHADCDHVSTKLARAICRRSRTVDVNR